MAKTLIRALILGAFALTVWQVGGSGGDRTVFAADLDCDDFTSQAAAQAHYDADKTDPDNLDSDDDGIACENFDYDGHDYCDNNVNYNNCHIQPDNYYGCNNPYYNGAPYTGAPIDHSALPATRTTTAPRRTPTTVSRTTPVTRTPTTTATSTTATRTTTTSARTA